VYVSATFNTHVRCLNCVNYMPVRRIWLFYFPAEVIGCVCDRAVMNFSFLVLVMAVEIEQGTSRLPG